MTRDADLTIVMNVTVAHATAAPDPDPGPAVPAHLAVFDRPCGAFGRLDRTFLRNARIFLDSHVPDQDVARHAFERKGGDSGFNLAVARLIGEIDLPVGIIEVECVALETVFTQDLMQRLIVDEHAFRQIARWLSAYALAVLAAVLRLVGRHPISPLANKARKQLAAVQNRVTLTVKALARLRPNCLHPVRSVFQAEHCALARAVDRRLDRSTRFDPDCTRRTGSVRDARGGCRCITEDQQSRERCPAYRNAHDERPNLWPAQILRSKVHLTPAD